MNSIKKYVLLVTTLLLSLPAFAQESDDREPSFSASLSTSIVSKYVWRGIVFNDNAVNQGELSLSYEGLSLAAWYNIDLSRENGQSGEMTEVDYIASYTFNLSETLSVETGFLYYDFPALTSGDTSAREVYATISLDTILNPSISAYYDIHEVHGFYLSAGVSHSFELAEKLSLEVAASIGWADEDQMTYYYGGQKSGFTDALLTATLTYNITDNLDISGSLGVSTLTGRGQDTNAGNDLSDEVFISSIGLSYSF